MNCNTETANNKTKAERQDHYKVLGLSVFATEEEIKREYKARMRQSHPDKNPENLTEGTQKTQEIVDAYDVLRDPAKRKAYDQEIFLSAQNSGVKTASSFAQNFSNVASSHPMLLKAVLDNDIAGVCQALQINSNYNEISKKTAIIIQNEAYLLSPLEVAITKRSLLMVQAIVSSCHQYLLHWVAVNGQIENNTFLIAAKFYDRTIFEYLVIQLKTQFRIASSTVFLTAIRFPDEKQYFHLALKTVTSVPLINLEPIEILVRNNADLYESSILKNLFDCNTSTEHSKLLKQLIIRNDPARFISVCTINNCTFAFSAMRLLKFQFQDYDVDPFLTMEKIQLTFSTLNSNILDRLIEELTSCGYKLRYEHFLHMADKLNNFVLLQFLKLTPRLQGLKLSSEQYFKIICRFIVNLDKFGRLEKEVLKVIFKNNAQSFYLSDDRNNNILHLTAQRRFASTDSVSLLLTFLDTELPIPPEKIDQLMGMRNKDMQLPEESIQKGKKIPEIMIGWRSRAANLRRHPISIPTEKSPTSIFWASQLLSEVSFSQLVDLIEKGDFSFFKSQIDLFGKDKLVMPKFGFCLLVKAIALHKADFVTYLLKQGSSIYLDKNQSYAEIIMNLATDPNIINLLNAAIKENNNSQGFKRPLQTNRTIGLQGNNEQVHKKTKSNNESATAEENIDSLITVMPF